MPSPKLSAIIRNIENTRGRMLLPREFLDYLAIVILSIIVYCHNVYTRCITKLGKPPIICTKYNAFLKNNQNSHV